MNFGRRARDDDAEINLIPFIDVLLVVLIFLMLSTTYARLNELQLTLPTADAQALKDRPEEIVVSVRADGRYAVDRVPLAGGSILALAGRLKDAAAARRDPMVIVVADAAASHQAVVNVLDAARRAGLAKLTFATQSSGAER